MTRCLTRKYRPSDIDNWSAGYTINDNVVADCPHTMFGWIFFQCFSCTKLGWHETNGSATAHSNTASGNSVCNSGIQGHPNIWASDLSRDPFNVIGGINVTGTINVSDCSALPPKGTAVITAAGVRPWK